jgi:hypothetical protein
MSMPRTSRRPSAFTPTAMITATEVKKWLDLFEQPIGFS